MRLFELSNTTLSIQSGLELKESKPEIMSMLDIIKIINQIIKDPVVLHLQQIRHSQR